MIDGEVGIQIILIRIIEILIPPKYLNTNDHPINANDLCIQLIMMKQFKFRHQYDNTIFIMCLCEVEVKLITEKYFMMLCIL